MLKIHRKINNFSSCLGSEENGAFSIAEEPTGTLTHRETPERGNRRGGEHRLVYMWPEGGAVTCRGG